MSPDRALHFSTVSKFRGYRASKRGQPSPYRGGDRRAAGTAGPARPGPSLAIAAVAVLGIWAMLAAGLVWPLVDVPLDGRLLGPPLDVAAAALAVGAALLCVRWWRLAGDAAALPLGAAVLLLGTLTIGTQSLLSLLGDPRAGGDVLGWLTPASRIAAIGLLWRAARTPDVDAGLRLGRTLARVIGATAVGVTVLTLAPGLARAVASAGDQLPTVEATALGSGVLAGAFLLLAAAHARRGLRGRHWLHAWFGLALLALALSEVLLLLLAAAGTPALAPAAAAPFAALPHAAPAALRACAMLCALAGAGAALARGFTEQRGRLFEEITSGMTAEARMRAEQLLAQERAHEARNALTAIEGATRTLEVYRERLDPDTQAELSRAITTEIARLQRLVSPEGAPSRAGAFPVAETLASVLVGARAGGTTVDTDLPDGLVASGRPAQTAEVVQNLIENARRYAPGSPVAVRAGEHRGGVLVRVEDRGPGVPAAEREAIFGRGYRGGQAATTEGTGLGLYICAKLMREQGGELWVEERPGGGASFALWLPGTAPAAGAAAEGDAATGATAAAAAGASNVYPLFAARPDARPPEPGPADPARRYSNDAGG